MYTVAISWRCRITRRCDMHRENGVDISPLIARFVGPTWGPHVADRVQVRPMFAPWTLLSGTALKAFNVCWPLCDYVGCHHWNKCTQMRFHRIMIMNLISFEIRSYCFDIQWTKTSSMWYQTCLMFRILDTAQFRGNLHGSYRKWTSNFADEY